MKKPCNCYYWMLNIHQCRTLEGKPVRSGNDGPYYSRRSNVAFVLWCATLIGIIALLNWLHSQGVNL